MRQRGLQVLIALDQMFNTIVGNGFADETLSARAFRNSTKSNTWKNARKVIDAIFFFQKNHCEIAYKREVDRAQLPTEYRELAEKRELL